MKVYTVTYVEPGGGVTYLKAICETRERAERFIEDEIKDKYVDLPREIWQSTLVINEREMLK